MNATLHAATRLLLIVLLLAAAVAAVIGVPGNMPTDLPQGPPNPSVPGFNNYPFMLSNVIAGPSPDPPPGQLRQAKSQRAGRRPSRGGRPVGDS